LADGGKFSDRQNICQKIHIHLWKKPLQKFLPNIFSHQKTFIYCPPKICHLWHILCVANDQPTPSQEPLMNLRNRTASLPLISPTFFVSCENNIPAMMVATECLR